MPVMRAPAIRAAEGRRVALQVGTVSARGVLAIISAGVAAGVPRDVLLQVAGLTDTDVLDPDARVSTTAEIAVWQLITRQVRDPGFGVRAGSAFRVREAGLLGYVVSFTPTLHGALTALQRYIHVFSQALTIRLEDAQVSLITAAPAPALESVPFAQDYRAAAVVNVGREITGVDFAPAEVHFAYAQPRSILAHREFFRGRLYLAVGSRAWYFVTPTCVCRPSAATPISRAISASTPIRCSRPLCTGRRCGTRCEP
jgi:hypothetical protein